jgi:hypothetical protein
VAQDAAAASLATRFVVETSCTRVLVVMRVVVVVVLLDDSINKSEAHMT